MGASQTIAYTLRTTAPNLHTQKLQWHIFVKSATRCPFLSNSADPKAPGDVAFELLHPGGPGLHPESCLRLLSMKPHSALLSSDEGRLQNRKKQVMAISPPSQGRVQKSRRVPRTRSRWRGHRHRGCPSSPLPQEGGTLSSSWHPKDHPGEEAEHSGRAVQASPSSSCSRSGHIRCECTRDASLPSLRAARADRCRRFTLR